MLLTTKARIHAMIWVLVISVGYYGVHGGMGTLMYFGNVRVAGPPGTMLGDNNNLALIEVMVVPLIYYLARHTENRFMRIGLWGAMVLQIVSVFGSYSRGAFVALSITLFAFWLRSKNKLVYAIIGGVVLAAALSVMPERFWDENEHPARYQIGWII